MVLDEALEERIGEILAPLDDALAGPRPGRGPRVATASRRWCRSARPSSSRSAPRRGSSCRPRDGTAARRSSSCPARRASCSRCGARRSRPRRSAPRSPGATEYRQHMLRLFGIPESEIAETLRRRASRRHRPRRARDHDLPAARRGRGRHALRAGAAGRVYDAFAAVVRERHADTLFSDDGTTVDEQVAALLRDARPDDRDRRVVHRRAARRAADRPARAPRTTWLGGVVVYSNAAKTALAGVDPALIARIGAVSTEVAEALADGARARAGRRRRRRHHRHRRARRRDRREAGRHSSASRSPGDGRRLTRRLRCPAARFDVRDRSTTVAMHLVPAAARRPLGPCRPAAEAVRAELAASLAVWAAPRRGRRPGAAAGGDDSLHVTLAFLGAMPREVDTLERDRGALRDEPWPTRCGSASRVARAAPPARADGRDRRRPRGACGLQERLVRGLSDRRRLRARPARFRPHVTVARVRRGQRRGTRAAAAARRPPSRPRP